MEFIKSWTISVCLTLVISAVFSLVSPRGSMGRFYKVVISVFIFVSLLYPFTDFDFSEFKADFDFESELEDTEVGLAEIQVENIIKGVLMDNGIEDAQVSCTVTQIGDEISVENVSVTVKTEYSASEVQEIIFDETGVAAEVTVN